MTGIGESKGCVSVINGIICGTGAVIGIALKTVATYEEGVPETVIECGTDDRLARICVKRTLEHIGAPEVPYSLKVESEIPPSRGLKSSSSASNAIIKAVLAEHGRTADPMEVVRLGVECSLEAGVTVTGSFDDSCGCELGGFIMTDNYERRIVSRIPVRPRPVIICVPEQEKVRVPRERYAERASDIKEAIDLCKVDAIFSAMNLNGRIVAEITGIPTEIMDIAMANGAVAAGVSGTGPAIAVVCNPGDQERIASKLPCRTIITEAV